MIFFSYFLEKQVKQKYYKTINFFAKFESSCHDKKQKWILETTNQVGYETRVQTFNPFPWDDYFFFWPRVRPKTLDYDWWILLQHTIVVVVLQNDIGKVGKQKFIFFTRLKVMNQIHFLLPGYLPKYFGGQNKLDFILLFFE